MEVLVALTVMALVMVVAAGALGQVGQGFRRGTDRADGVEAVAQARDVLRRQAARAFPVVEVEGNAIDRGRYVFEGRSDSLAFVIAEPPAPGRGGFALARFQVEGTAGGGERLVYSQRPLGGGEERRSILAEGPYRFSFEYQQVAEGESRWLSRWPDPGSLPRLIRMDVRVAGRPQPRAVVRFRADAERGCVLDLGEGFCRDWATILDGAPAGGRP